MNSYNNGTTLVSKETNPDENNPLYRKELNTLLTKIGGLDHVITDIISQMNSHFNGHNVPIMSGLILTGVSGSGKSCLAKSLAGNNCKI